MVPMILLPSRTLSSVRASYLLIYVIRENKIFISVILHFSIHEPCQKTPLYKHMSQHVLISDQGTGFKYLKPYVDWRRHKGQ